MQKYCKHRLGIQVGAKRAKTCMQCVYFPTELPFLHAAIGGWVLDLVASLNIWVLPYLFLPSPPSFVVRMSGAAQAWGKRGKRVLYISSSSSSWFRLSEKARDGYRRLTVEKLPFFCRDAVSCRHFRRRRRMKEDRSHNGQNWEGLKKSFCMCWGKNSFI